MALLQELKRRKSAIADNPYRLVKGSMGVLICPKQKIPASGRNGDLKETYTFETIILVSSW
jgi:hypothetical protein